MSNVPIDQRTSKEPARGKITAFLTNPHLWILAAMFAALTVIYSWDMIHYNQRWDWLYNLTVFEFRYSFHGSLFSLPIIYAAYIFRWRGAVIAWSLSMAVVIPRILSYKYDPL